MLFKRLYTQAASVHGRSSDSGLIVTVFGATGFVGRYVVNKFGRIGSRVVIPYRGEEKDFQHLKVMGDVGQIIPTPFHIRHTASVEKAVSRSNVVVNLVGKHYDTKNFTIEQANIDSARIISEACAKTDNVKRVIFLSSVLADAKSPSRLYRAKFEAEKITQSVLGDRATIVRSTQVFGDEDRLLNRLGHAARYWPVLPELPTRIIAPLFVGDLADALVAIARNNDSRTFDLAGERWDQQILINDLLRAMHLDPIRVKFPPRVLLWAAKVQGMLRQHTMNADEFSTIRISEAEAVREDVAHMEDLNIPVTPLEKAAMAVVRRYRPAYSFYHVGNEDILALQAQAEAQEAKFHVRVNHPYELEQRRERLVRKEPVGLGGATRKSLDHH